MFGNFSLPELLIVGAIALIVIGPKDLPKMMRSVGKFIGQAKGMARQFQDSMNEAAREADLAEFREARNLMKGKTDTKAITDTFNKSLDLDEKPKAAPAAKPATAPDPAPVAAPADTVAASEPAAADAKAS